MKQSKPVTFTREVTVTSEADIEIDLDELAAELDGEQHDYLLGLLSEGTPEVKKLAEQVFYHYSGAPYVPPSVRELVYSLIGRIL